MSTSPADSGKRVMVTDDKGKPGASRTLGGFRRKSELQDNKKPGKVYTSAEARDKAMALYKSKVLSGLRGKPRRVASPSTFSRHRCKRN